MLAQLAITAVQVNSRIADYTRGIEQIGTELHAIERDLAGLRTKILRDALREARLVATTLTKVTISRALEDQNFGVLLVDEASMAPLPSLYYTTAHVAQKAVIVGYFRQLLPISAATSAMAQR